MVKQMNIKDDPASPRLDLTLHIHNPLWLHAISDIESLTVHVMETALAYLDITQTHLEASVVLADNNFVQVYNSKFRGKDKPTNVLSFSALEKEHVIAEGDNLGDILMAVETLEEEAKEQGKSFKDHYIHLVVHGLLHLIGYDHQSDVEADEMETLETKILNQLGVANPYEQNV